MYRYPQHSDNEHGHAVGWISIAELFLLVGALLLASVFLYHHQLSTAKAEYATLKDEQASLQSRHDDLLARARKLEEQLNALTVDGQDPREVAKRVLELKEQVRELNGLLEQLSADLIGLEQERQRLHQEKTALVARVRRLNEDLSQWTAWAGMLLDEADEVRKEARAFEEKWKAEQARSAELAREAQKEREAARQAKAELATLQNMLAQVRLQKQESDRQVMDLKTRLKTFENRFEGLRLEGEKVVFLVDRSGSMVEVRDGQVDPEKWPTVCENVGRIMKSLPDLKKYQLVLFSRDVSFPLGKDGQWLDYDPVRTPESVVRLLKDVKPEGGTNLHGGFEAAFQYRPQGLQAIYLFSDGLPTIGKGLTAAEEQHIAALRAKKTRDAYKEAEEYLEQKLGPLLLRTISEQWNRDRKVRIESVGFFYESHNLGSFLWALSRENGGNFVGMSKP
jgi:uncharacterized coiled-coil DUF342 family protein